jgi:hypothetical protein
MDGLRSTVTGLAAIQDAQLRIGSHLTRRACVQLHVPLAFEVPHDLRRDRPSDPLEHLDRLAHVLLGKGGRLPVVAGDRGRAQHHIADNGEAARGVVIAKILGEGMRAHGVNRRGGEAEQDAHTLLGAINERILAPQSLQSGFETGNMPFGRGHESLQCAADVRLLTLGVAHLTLQWLKNVALKDVHVRDILRDYFNTLLWHWNPFHGDVAPLEMRRVAGR